MTKPDWEGFGRDLLDSWPVGDIDGDDLFDLALKHRLVVSIPGGFNPEIHEDYEGIGPDPGDPWFKYNFRPKGKTP
jgi:hypothetical protein